MSKVQAKHNQGFTLIELMIGLTIIGILMVVGLPFFSGYQTRAKASHGVAAFAPAKKAVSIYYQVEGRFPTSNAEAGLEPPGSFQSDFVRSLTVGNGGVVSVRFSTPALNNGELVFTPEFDGLRVINWTCSTLIPHRLVPPACRN